jgi:hypothetical protein
MSGKGSKPRPVTDREKFEANWNKIFGVKKEQKPVEKTPKPSSS